MTETVRRRQVLAWAAWDWGSAAFNAVMVTFVFGAYLASDAFGPGGRGTAWLSTGMAIAGAAVALTAPVMGRQADRTGRRRLWLAVSIPGYAFVTPPPHDGASNPLFYEVVRQGSWLTAYATRPWILIAPVLGFLGAFMAWWSMRSGGSPLKWSMISIFGMISSVGLVMFPFMLPSRTAPTSSLAVWDSSSSHLSLFVMLVSAAIFLPTIMLYTAWVYRVLRGKVTPAEIEDPGTHSY